ncbi:unnamed protein product [Protopolystoma xenopodis]|uniref:Cadherin domain-containing protein n=1 Tax=Protopolystoma xenopodis TaxID=117903 RepID=A0A3S5C3G9_9PLAT|nr:unnamed protein product [Protopolystoma xenopodis]
MYEIDKYHSSFEATEHFGIQRVTGIIRCIATKPTNLRSPVLLSVLVSDDSGRYSKKAISVNIIFKNSSSTLKSVTCVLTETLHSSLSTINSSSHTNSTRFSSIKFEDAPRILNPRFFMLRDVKKSPFYVESETGIIYSKRAPECKNIKLGLLIESNELLPSGENEYFGCNLFLSCNITQKTSEILVGFLVPTSDVNRTLIRQVYFSNEHGLPDYIFTIPPDAPVGFLVGTLHAYGSKDINLEFKKLNENQAYPCLHLNAESGNIRLWCPVKEVWHKFPIEFLVGLVVNGALSKLKGTQVLVRILRENTNFSENLPSFPVFSASEYHFYVHEFDALPNHIVGRLLAVDADTRKALLPSAWITFGRSESRDSHSINPESKEFTSKIGIFPDGTVFIDSSQPLDRERSAYLVSFAFLNFSHPGSSPILHYCRIILYILDDNDNEPVFIQSSYTFELAEKAKISEVFGRIFAIDADQGLNSLITYQIMLTNLHDESHILPYIELDPLTGEFYTLAPIDRESLVTIPGVHLYKEDPLFNLTIVVLDSGTPRLSSSAIVTIIIKDVNDNPPSFSSSVYYAKALLNDFSQSTNDTFIVLGPEYLKVSDPDSSKLTNLHFGITSVICETSHNLDINFSIEETTGALSISFGSGLSSNVLSHSVYYHLLIFVTDRTDNQGLASHSEVIIELETLDEAYLSHTFQAAPWRGSENGIRITQLSEFNFSIVVNIDYFAMGSILFSFTSASKSRHMNKHIVAETHYHLQTGIMDDFLALDSKWGFIYLRRPVSTEHLNVILTWELKASTVLPWSGFHAVNETIWVSFLFYSNQYRRPTLILQPEEYLSHVLLLNCDTLGDDQRQIIGKPIGLRLKDGTSHKPALQFKTSFHVPASTHSLVRLNSSTGFFEALEVGCALQTRKLVSQASKRGEAILELDEMDELMYNDLKDNKGELITIGAYACLDDSYCTPLRRIDILMIHRSSNKGAPCRHTETAPLVCPSQTVMLLDSLSLFTATDVAGAQLDPFSLNWSLPFRLARLDGLPLSALQREPPPVGGYRWSRTETGGAETEIQTDWEGASTDILVHPSSGLLELLNVYRLAELVTRQRSILDLPLEVVEAGVASRRPQFCPIRLVVPPLCSLPHLVNKPALLQPKQRSYLAKVRLFYL